MQAYFTSQLYDPRMAQHSDSLRGKRLRAFRQSAGLSQSELAQRLGVHRSNIGFWENNGIIPRSDLLTPMAEALGVTVNDLLGKASKPQRVAAPMGRARLVFDQVSKLPRRQQQHIIRVVEDLIAAQRLNAHAKAA
jgi:transcriptional regulator with XRE-family HTH domain